MELVVEAVDASKRYGATLALSNATLSIASGEVVALLGPNGAGKTTFISLILGLRKPTTGSIRLFGLDPRDRRTRSRCGVMLQESGVPDFLKVNELVDQFRSYYPHPLSRDTAIKMAGLTHKADALVITLSGGERQRLYFAVAMCGDPEAMLLDEPTVGMDVEGRRAFWSQMRELVRSGRTVLLTTHYLEEADAIADRIVVVDKGRIIADAAPSELKGRIEERRVSFDAAPVPEFDGLPVHQLEVTGSRVTLLTSEPVAVLKALFARGCDVRNLEVVGASLEEAVIGLTTRASA